MVAMCTTMAIILSWMLSRAYPVGPVRGRKLRNMEYWVYSKKPVILDILVNIIIIAATMAVLVSTAEELPDSYFPVRVWLAVYALHCFVNVVLVWFQYRRLARRSEADFDADGYGYVDGDGFVVVVYHGSRISYSCRCDALNLLASLFWETVGLCWTLPPSRDKLLRQSAPWLYRLTTICLTYDAIFGILCLVGIVVCFSLSRITAIMYTAAGQKQEDASDANLSMLPKYRFHMSSNGESPSVGAGVTVPMDTVSGDSGTGCDLLRFYLSVQNAVSAFVLLMAELSSMLYHASIVFMQHAWRRGSKSMQNAPFATTTF